MADVRQIYTRVVHDGGPVRNEVINQGSAVTDVGAPVAITYTLNDPGITTNGAVTVADGSTPTVAELLELCEELLANVTDLRTQVNSLLATCRSAGLIAT